MCLTIFFTAFGLIGLVKGEIKITHNRRLRGVISRVLGVLLLVAAAITFIFGSEGLLWALGIAALVIVIGLVEAEKIEK